MKYRQHWILRNTENYGQNLRDSRSIFLTLLNYIRKCYKPTVIFIIYVYAHNNSKWKWYVTANKTVENKWNMLIWDSIFYSDFLCINCLSSYVHCLGIYVWIGLKQRNKKHVWIDLINLFQKISEIIFNVLYWSFLSLKLSEIFLKYHLLIFFFLLFFS